MASFDRAKRAASDVTCYELDAVDFSSERRPRARHYDRDVVVESDRVAWSELEISGEVNSCLSSAKQRAWQ
ncbi:hypothetical protein G9X67_20210 [Rhizobium sp. WYCCWR 11152]|uniref:hypothetical protein n=1 Tax=Rhizobium sp. WYCCWR 11152 TaxID=2692316 RepID=UPI00149149F7|nr:hypothetical protein [Rhizobium sp. WYCCWR 11152]NNU67588.1 hypothetical protein [Rhizobium sp. WYCCWR 11152]